MTYDTLLLGALVLLSLTCAGKLSAIARDVSDVQDRLMRVHPLSKREREDVAREAAEDAELDV